MTLTWEVVPRKIRIILREFTTLLHAFRFNYEVFLPFSDRLL